MPPAVHVILGPARSGKTAHVLEKYRQSLTTRGQPGSALWLAPTLRTANAIRGQILYGGLTACFRPNCFTFSQFASQVLQTSPLPMRPVDAFLKQQLLRRLVDEAQSAGVLKHFASIAETDGLIQLISSFIADLKRQEIWPERFQATVSQLHKSQKYTELAWIYARYQALLQQHLLYDAEGKFWSARDLLSKRIDPPWDQLRLVIVDGFTDFTWTQHEILEILARQAEELVVTLPYEDAASGRSDLFHKCAATLSELQKRHVGLEISHCARKKLVGGTNGTDWPAMAHLEQNLLKDPRSIQPLDNADRIELLAASSQLGEIQLLARRIKKLLVVGEEGGATGPIAAEQIVVVFRSTGEIADLVREVFAEVGIPLAIDAQESLGKAPIFLALLDFLKLESEDWPFRKVLQVILHNYFRPGWSEWKNAKAVLACEQVVRALQVPNGRAALMKAVEHLAELELPENARPERLSRRSEAQIASTVLKRLFKAYDQLPKSGTVAEWIAALTKFSEELGIISQVVLDPNSADQTPAGQADQQAWTVLLDELQSSSQMEVWLDGEPRRWSLSEMIERIALLGRNATLPRATDEAGRVRVISATSARGLDIPYLFLAGLSEKAFPPSLGDEHLLSVSECRQFNRTGLAFLERHDRTCGEMLLFYEVITRATQRLYLSYPALDDSAQPLLPSPFLSEVERLFAPDALARTTVADLSPVPQELEPCSLQDWRVKGVSLALEGETALLVSLTKYSPSAELSGNLLSSLQMNASRSVRGEFGEYEGLLRGDAARQVLAERYGTDHCWSTSQLEQYAICPYKFFMQRVLRLKEPADLSLDTDYFVRGRRVHALLARLHRALNEGGVPRLPSEFDGDFSRLYQDTLAELLSQTDGGPLDRAFATIDRELIARWLEDYTAQHEAYDSQFNTLDERPRPRHFEVAFGPTTQDDDEDRCDEISVAKPFELDCQGVAIKLSGRIDRIDVGLHDGQVVFNILDYKTSAASRFKPEQIEKGTALQLPLYALAVQELILRDLKAVPWMIGYWHVKDGGFSKHPIALHESGESALTATDDWNDLRPKMLARVASLVTGIRQAEFPMHCEDEHCTSRCPYSTVCRVATVRALDKSWPPFQPEQTTEEVES